MEVQGKVFGEGLIKLREELSRAISPSEVLKFYGKADLSNIGEQGLVDWQEDCARQASLTKGGEVVAVTLFQMANETRNSIRLAEKTVGEHSVLANISRSLSKS